MAWPPPVLPINITDATPQQTTHADLHNKLAQAMNDAVPLISAMQHRYVVQVGAVNSGATPAGPNPNGTFDLTTVTIAAATVPTHVVVGAAFSSAYDAGAGAGVTFTGDIQVISSAGISGGSGRANPTVAGAYSGATVFAIYPIAAGVAASYKPRISIAGLAGGSFGYTFWSTAYIQVAAQ